MQRSEITTGFVDEALKFIDQTQADQRPFFNLWPDDVHGPWWPPLDKWGGHEPGTGTSRPFRGAKTWMYEGDIRFPLIVWAPGLIIGEKNGSTNDTSVFSAIDLNRSLCTLTGTKPSEKLDGEDLSETIIGKSTASRKAAIFWRRPPDRPGFGHGFKEDNPDLAVRDGDWKYLINHGGSDPQLYNLPKDPGERQNLEAKHPKIVTRLDKDLRAWNSTIPIDGSDPIFKKVKIRPLKPKR